MRKIYLDLSLRVIVNADDDVTMDDIMENLDVKAELDMEGADLAEQEVADYDIADSK